MRITYLRLLLGSLLATAALGEPVPSQPSDLEDIEPTTSILSEFEQGGSLIEKDPRRFKQLGAENIAKYPLYRPSPGKAFRYPYRTRKITRNTCPVSQRPHCCADFEVGKTEITKYDSCMPLIPGDTCKAQTICCVVLQGIRDPARYVMRRYGCADVTMLADEFTDPREYWYGHGEYPFDRRDADWIDGYNNPIHKFVSQAELDRDPANNPALAAQLKAKDAIAAKAAQAGKQAAPVAKEYDRSTDEKSQSGRLKNKVEDSEEDEGYSSDEYTEAE
ncbi:hypothetical protein BJ508DRAFT_324512 [Ascobolus immersus RN42]|uniref:Secreted protein n=1 Tax=Ascobolus immersus RN42 TaxID=1160509 RepID=A0A3N4IBM0_ASCIM|nr:hypothetical protein BJ508DRAFT_324512 [Ascobolus immersus RN42]